MRLLGALASRSDDQALQLLAEYYGDPVASPQSRSGAAFDTWDTTGTRAQDVDRFTADDLVAATLLSVSLSGAAARRLLVDGADRYGALLKAVGPDLDLADVPDAFADDGPEWTLHAALLELPGVGPTRASSWLASVRAFARSTTRWWRRCWGRRSGTGSRSDSSCA